MKKVIGRTITIVIIMFAVGAGFLYKFFLEQYERTTHPQGYSDFVDGYASFYGVPSDIVYAVIKIESSYNENALSSKGAVGLMQITPDTFTWLMSKTGEILKEDALYSPQINIKYGVFFLSYLYDEFGSWDIVYAAYNAGMARVKGWLIDPAVSENGKLIYIPFKETERYVKLVGDTAETYRRLYPQK
jgi:soluble lytic murein transglycosylase